MLSRDPGEIKSLAQQGHYDERKSSPQGGIPALNVWHEEKFSRGSNIVLCCLQPQMGGFDLAGLKDRKKRGRGCRLLHRAVSTGLFTFYQARNPDNPEPKLAGGFNCLDSGAAGGANVVHNDDACAFF